MHASGRMQRVVVHVQTNLPQPLGCVFLRFLTYRVPHIPRSTVTAHNLSERCNRHILVSPWTGQSPDYVDDGRFERGAGRVWYQLAQA